MSEIAIRVNNVSKVYPLYKHNRQRLLEVVHPLRKKYHTDFYALKEISLEIKKGESVGIIGQNGSGKSTLLKIISGVLTPTSGNVEVNGRVSSLLELGTGFNPEMTGIENVFFYGSINGIGRKKMEKRLDSILAFADIGDFIHQPVKTYSSGMFVRLAFSCAINVEPEILIVDEALAVGDIAFQAKCMTMMRRMLNSGITFLFVTHDINGVKGLCKQAIWLENGILKEYGESGQVTEIYYQNIVKQTFGESTANLHLTNNSNWDTSILKREFKLAEFTVGKSTFDKISQYNKSGDGTLEILNVSLVDEAGNLIQKAEFAQSVRLNCLIRNNSHAGYCHIAYHLRDKNMYDLVYSDTLIENSPIHSKPGDLIAATFQFNCSLREGIYVISVMASYSPIDNIHDIRFGDFRPISYSFEVAKREPFALYGAVHWPNTVTIQRLGYTDSILVK
jgi:lipopolysaccharide transport system ATP-binding protein